MLKTTQLFRHRIAITLISVTTTTCFLPTHALAAESPNQVNPPSLQAVENLLKRQLKDVPGVEITKNPDGLDTVEVSGTIKQARDCGRVRKVLADTRARWGQVVTENVVYQPDVASVQSAILAAMTATKVENPTVEVTADLSRIGLQGSVYSEAQAAETLRVVEIQIKKLDIGEVSLVSNLRQDTSSFEVEVVRFDLNEDLLKDIGEDLLSQLNSLSAVGTAAFLSDKGTLSVQNFDNTANINGIAVNKQPNYAVMANVNVGNLLRFLDNEAKVVQLTRFTVVTLNGQEGRAVNATCVQVPVYRGENASPSALETANIGALVRAKVTLRDAKTVQLFLDCETGEFDGSESNFSKLGYITSQKRQVVNTLELPLNSQAILGVVEHEITSKAQSGTPYLRHIPVLNWFFGEEKNASNRAYSGLVVVVRRVGAVVTEDPSVSARTEEMIKKVRERLTKR